MTQQFIAWRPSILLLDSLVEHLYQPTWTFEDLSESMSYRPTDYVIDLNELDINHNLYLSVNNQIKKAMRLAQPSQANS